MYPLLKQAVWNYELFGSVFDMSTDNCMAWHRDKKKIFFQALVISFQAVFWDVTPRPAPLKKRLLTSEQHFFDKIFRFISENVFVPA